ncbi:MAG TPA: polysaccharide biosynthesis/export family protein [Gammaproteobacteria bacterium]|nr:polysaccharide biosynthesis/export family protein [Gammaproteobacteria bacterium]
MKNALSRARTPGLLLSLVIAASAVAAERPASVDAGVAGPSYQLQPGDVVEISVWKEPDLRREALVRSDGALTFSLIGDLMVAGRTTVDVQQEVETRLAKFIPDAVVTVAVMQINGNQVYVVGKVNRPGVYKFERKVDVMQALALGGGTTEFAGVNDIRILRRTPSGEQQTFKFEYEEVARGRRLEQNIVLQSGDTLVVP